MKIVVLEGSPNRHASSNLLAEEFIRGAKEAGHTAEIIDAAHADLHPCTGCVRCGYEGPCVQKDDMADILDKMVQADVILLATPVYFYSMDGQMKTFIDRTVPRYTEIRDKDFYFILTAADTEKANLERTMEAFRGFTEDCLDGAREAGVIYGTGAWKIGEIKNTPAYEEAYQMGRNI